MSFHQDDFGDLEGLIFGSEDSINAVIEDLSSEQSYMHFCDEVLEGQDQDDSPNTMDQVFDGGLFQESLMALNDNDYGNDFLSLRYYMASCPTGNELADHQPQPDMIPYRTEYQIGELRPLPEPILHPTEFQDSDARPSPEHNPYQTGYQIPEENPRTVLNRTVVDYHGPTTMDDTQAPYSFGVIDNLVPKREASAVSRRLSEITVEEDKAFGNPGAKRMRTSEDEGTNNDLTQDDSRRKRRQMQTTPDEDHKTEWDDSTRPKYARKIFNENARYRHALKLQKAEPLYPEGVKSLYQHLKSDIIPKKEYYRRKRSEARVSATDPEGRPGTQAGTAAQAAAAASHQALLPAAGTVLSGTGGATSSSTPNRRIRQTNPRQHIPVETVRQAAPEGWDPYDNEYYSGDDNISDGERETRGKATDYKPPRMACRRCNKLKQPCDHAYPACSLCAKYGKRCRYRDDLTGRQIRPGQLEEVEVALHDAQKEIRRLKKQVKEMEETQNLRDDAQK